MKTYLVKVKTESGEKHEFEQDDFSSASVAENASARFGGLCSVFVVLA